MTGFGMGDFVRLKDEFGTVWQGMIDAQEGDTIRYRFRDPRGRVITGISDRYGIILRDESGVSWRGYVY